MPENAWRSHSWHSPAPRRQRYRAEWGTEAGRWGWAWGMSVSLPIHGMRSFTAGNGSEVWSHQETGGWVRVIM